MKQLSSKRRSLCPISISLDIFGDKWSLLILRDMIFCGFCHYKDFLSSKENISTNILANRLALLEANDIILRKPDPDSARQVIYLPTDKALDLIPVLIELIAWGDKYGGGKGTPKIFISRLKEDKDALIAEIRGGLISNLHRMI